MPNYGSWSILRGEVGWANVWKTQGGAVRSVTNIYSLVQREKKQIPFSVPNVSYSVYTVQYRTVQYTIQHRSYSGNNLRFDKVQY